MASVYGIDKKQAEQFFKAMGTIASSGNRADPEQMKSLLSQTHRAVLPRDWKPYGGKFNKSLEERGGGVGRSGVTFQDKQQESRFLASQNIMVGVDSDSLLKAFRLRQEEVFSRRARPGVMAQTRFM